MNGKKEESYGIREIAADLAGLATGIVIYGAEALTAKGIADFLSGGFRSPDQFTSGIYAICVVALVGALAHDAVAREGEVVKGVALLGLRAGFAVRQAIRNFR